MFNYTSCTVCGRLGRDPELRHTPTGHTVTEPNIAVTYKKKGGEEETFWTKVLFWDESAEYICKYARKGDMLVCSNMQYVVRETGTDDDGTPIRTHQFNQQYGSRVDIVPKMMEGE